MWVMREFIRRRQAKITEYILGRPYLNYVHSLRGGRDLEGFFVGGTRIIVRQKKG